MNFTPKLLLQVVAATFAGLAILFGVAAWRLSSGPVSVAFLSPYVERAFEAEDLSYHIEFEDTILTWAGWDRSLDVSVVNARAIGADGKAFAIVPEISLGLSGLALLRGVVAPTSVELIRPEVFLTRTEEGEFNIALGPVSPDTDEQEEDVERVITDFLSPADKDEPLGRLRRVSIVGARLRIEDAVSGLTLRSTQADLTLELDDERILGEFALDIGAKGVVTELAGRTSYERSTRVTDAVLRIEEIVPARLATISPWLEELDALRLPVEGSLMLSFGADGTLHDGIRFDLAGAAGTIALPEVFAEELAVQIVQVRGEVDPEFALLRLDDFFVDAGGPSATFAGIIEDAADGVGINGSVGVSDLPLDELYRYWPMQIIGNARNWIVNNISDGVMTRFEAQLDLKPGEFGAGGGDLRGQAVRANFEFRDVTVNYLHPMPRVRGVDGTGRIEGETMTLDMRDGRIGEVYAQTGQARLLKLTSDNPMIVTTIQGEAPAEAAVALLDHPRFAFASRLGFRPDQFSGAVSAQVGFQFPLRTDLRVEQISVEATSRLTDLDARDLFGSFDVRDADLQLGLDNEGLDVRGTAVIEGMTSDLTWRQNFGEDSPFRSRYEVSGKLHKESQQAFGLALEPYADGVFDLDLVYTEGWEGQPHAAVALGARDVELIVPELFWSKLRGKDASIHILAELPEDGTIAVQSFELISRSLRAEGRAHINPATANTEVVEITRLVHGATNIGADIRATPEGGYDVKITGKSLDLRPYFRQLREGSDEAAPPFVLEFDVDRLITRSDQQITRARGRVVNSKERMESAYLEGTLVTGKGLRIRLDPSGPKRRLLVQSDDAGSVARAFDIYDNALGGKLVMEAILHDDEPKRPVSGEVRIENYSVINAPTLANILNVGSFTGTLDVLQGEGITFDTFQLPFRFEDDVVTVDSARTSGPSIGINAEGLVDLAGNSASIRGTIVPAYSLNSVLGEIPLIGELLVGGKGEGLFAATYTVTGALDEPRVVVNPLAALAPGILRNLFSVFDGVESRRSDGDTAPSPPVPEFKR